MLHVSGYIAPNNYSQLKYTLTSHKDKRNACGIWHGRKRAKSASFIIAKKSSFILVY